MEYKFVTSLPPIGGRIKKYYEDFLVEEIGLDYSTKITYLPDKKVDFDWQEVYDQKKPGYDYLHVDLEKANVSTTNAIKQASRFLRVSKKKFSYAGLKDKRAITVQRISIYDPEFSRISKFYYKNIKIYNPHWEKKRIGIGDLKRNRFIITLRGIKNKTKEELQTIVDSFISEVNKKGIINYFGEQRFGGVRQITHEVGKLLLERKYKEAVILYLTKTSKFEREEIKKAREELKNDLNFAKHAANFPTRTGYESAILNHLANNPEDFLGSFKVMPKSIQFLFTHAYQSYLFNEIINARLERGYSVDQKIPGDNIVDDKIMIPIFGFESSFSPKEAGIIEKEVLDKEGISLEAFENPDYGVLSSKGAYRDIHTKVYDLKLIDISKDDRLREDEEDVGALKLTLSFALDKGKYATNVIRELIKPKELGWF